MSEKYQIYPEKRSILRIIISGSVYHYSLTSSFPRNPSRRRVQTASCVFTRVKVLSDNYFSWTLQRTVLITLRATRPEETKFSVITHRKCMQTCQ